MQPLTRRTTIAATAATFAVGKAHAETGKLRVSHGYSIGYLPLMVMRDQNLIEKHASDLGVGKISVEWQIQDGGNNINDAILAGALDIAGIGIPGFLVLRDRTLGRHQEMVGISALDAGSLWLNTINPRIQSLADYTAKDKIAVPGIKTSYAAVILEMAVAKQFGMENYTKLDPNMVGLAHPDAYTALMSGSTEITSHMASPPFSYQELKNPKVHRVLSTTEAVGLMTILMTMTQRQFAQANPNLIRAFLAANEEANAFITNDRAGALKAYAASSQLKVPPDQLQEMLADPENSYSTAPSGSLIYASFLAQTGTLKNKPAAWTDLFLPDLHDRKGT
jgi:NitT/TauT family transport system substrate-binding protein